MRLSTEFFVVGLTMLMLALACFVMALALPFLVVSGYVSYPLFEFASYRSSSKSRGTDSPDTPS
jgi:hypothetical protein